MSAYYSENDPFAAAWLRELIKAGHIAPPQASRTTSATGGVRLRMSVRAPRLHDAGHVPVSGLGVRA